ncbi:MAG: hypothetical protein FWG72_09370 [Oscillospiraceae bacterium]|nr:hypothetical protein [Oscillospiraceae bacterium]
MTSLLIKAMTYGYPEELPVSVWAVPSMWKHYGGEMTRFAKEYAEFFPSIPAPGDMPETYRLGQHTDEWGCVWSNIEEGMESVVTGHPVPERGDILTLRIPEVRSGGVPHGFMYLRLLDLRGFEEAMLDFAEECEELQILIDKVLDYNCRHIRARLPYVKDYMIFGDDLGMQTGLAIGSERWRKYLKPCYAKMFSIVREAGKLVYMHSDGMIYDIMPDLRECGADMINPQYRANGLENLARVCKGKIPVDLDLDRQLFPFATPSELDDHVRECVETLYLPQGGLGLYIELNYDTPLQNAAALLDAARKYRTWR